MSNRYSSETPESERMYARARKVLPAGVSYIIRHFEPYPLYTNKAKGSKLFDVDGNQYIDFWMGHCSLILGHSPSEVMEKVGQQISQGTHYGTNHELEIALAEQVVKMIPGADMVRFTNSGTEAIMYGTRLARTITRRTKIAKFEGGWHGGYDATHIGVKPPLYLPESGGLTSGVLQDTIVLPFNDIEGVKKKVKDEELAAIVVEPVLGAGGGIPAEKEFLRELKELCTERETLLIFDEVITGFRLSPGGAQQYYGVQPDITVLGKILGGGFPVGAVTGQRAIMEYMDGLKYERPEFSFQGGTFCANPVTMTAGLATLRKLEDGRILGKLNKRGEYIRRQLFDIFERSSLDVQVTGVSSLFHTHFTKEIIRNIHDVFAADRERLQDYHMHLIENGVFFLPTKTGALATVHTKEDLDKFLREAEAYVENL